HDDAAGRHADVGADHRRHHRQREQQVGVAKDLLALRGRIGDVLDRLVARAAAKALVVRAYGFQFGLHPVSLLILSLYRTKTTKGPLSCNRRGTCRGLKCGRYGRFSSPGEMAERSNAAVLKTVSPQGLGGSNPSLSARTFLLPVPPGPILGDATLAVDPGRRDTLALELDLGAGLRDRRPHAGLPHVGRDCVRQRHAASQPVAPRLKS